MICRTFAAEMRRRDSDRLQFAIRESGVHFTYCTMDSTEDRNEHHGGTIATAVEHEESLSLRSENHDHREPRAEEEGIAGMNLNEIRAVIKCDIYPLSLCTFTTFTLLYVKI